MDVSNHGHRLNNSTQRNHQQKYPQFGAMKCIDRHR